MTTDKTSKMTEACRRHRADIASLIDFIAQDMDARLKDAETTPGNWSIEAQMARIRWHLIETAASCMGTEPERIVETLADMRDDA
jgi:hypothetical protein